MSQEKATAEAVLRAAETIKAAKVAQGKKPSVSGDEIVAEIGGSKQHVLARMEELGLSRPSKIVEADVMVPALILEKAKPLLGELYSIAKTLEADSHSSFVRRYDEHMTASEALIRETAEKLGVLEDEVVRLNRCINDLSNERNQLLHERDEAAAQLSATERRARDAEQALVSLEAKCQLLEGKIVMQTDLEAQVARLVKAQLKAVAAPA